MSCRSIDDKILSGIRDSIHACYQKVDIATSNIEILEKGQSNSLQIVSTANESIANQIGSLGTIVGVISLLATIILFFLSYYINEKTRLMREILKKSEDARNHAISSEESAKALYEKFSSSKTELLDYLLELQSNYFISKIENEPSNVVNIGAHLNVFSLTRTQIDRLMTLFERIDADNDKIRRGIFSIIISSDRKAVLESESSRALILSTFDSLWRGLFKSEAISLCEEVYKIKDKSDKHGKFYIAFTKELISGTRSNREQAFMKLVPNKPTYDSLRISLIEYQCNDDDIATFDALFECSNSHAAASS